MALWRIQNIRLLPYLNNTIHIYTNVSDFAIINHPVHIVDMKKEISPSAFIPFCDFGGNMSTVGVKIDKFDVPVCNSFQAKILNDQLCYEVDLKKFADKENIENELQSGFNFLMDYNEDRMITFDNSFVKTEEDNLVSSFVESVEDKNAYIYLNTIGTVLNIFIVFIFHIIKFINV